MIDEFSHNMKLLEELLVAEPFFPGMSSEVPYYIEKNFILDSKRMEKELYDLYLRQKEDTKEGVLFYMGKISKSNCCLDLFEYALLEDNSMIKLAAVEALENLGTESCLRLLESHKK